MTTTDTDTTVLVPFAAALAVLGKHLENLQHDLAGVTYGSQPVTTEGVQRDRQVLNRGRLVDAIDHAQSALTRLLIVGAVYTNCPACEAALNPPGEEEE